MAAGDKLAFLAEERRVVDGEQHAHGRLVDGYGRQRVGILEVADGVSNLETLKADDGADVAAGHFGRLHMAHALKRVQFLNARLLHGAVAVGYGDIHALAQHTAVNASHGNAACIVGVVERRDEHLRRALNHLRRRDNLDNLVQKVVDVARGLLVVFAHPAVLGRAVDHGEVELVFGGVEREHQVEHHLVHLFGAAVGFVDLVYHHYGLQPYLQGLLQHKPRLRHRALKGVDEQQTAVGHVQHALHLAAEVRVARGVYDVYLRSFPIDGDVFREDCYAPLALQVVAVEHLPAEVLPVAEQVSGEHHLVHQRCLSVVNVGNDCYVSDVLH